MGLGANRVRTFMPPHDISQPKPQSGPRATVEPPVHCSSGSRQCPGTRIHGLISRQLRRSGGPIASVLPKFFFGPAGIAGTAPPGSRHSEQSFRLWFTGRVAQWESTVFTRRGSLVQSQPRPPSPGRAAGSYSSPGRNPKTRTRRRMSSDPHGHAGHADMQPGPGEGSTAAQRLDSRRLDWPQARRCPRPHQGSASPAAHIPVRHCVASGHPLHRGAARQ